MKPLLLFCLLFSIQTISAQSLDYLSIRMQNGRAVKNIYSGSGVLLQLADGSYLTGPVQTIRNDSVYVTVYDIRYYPTSWGSYVKDTISTTLTGVLYKDIARVYLNQRRTFFQRSAGPLLMLGGGGYLVLNVLNGGLSESGSTNNKRLGIAAGAAGMGFLLRKLFASDGFSKKKHQIVYVDL